IFLAIVLATALIVSALIVNARRPAIEVQQPSAQLVEASGKCAECHARETSAIVIEYRRSHHAQKGVTCLDCHRAVAGQDSMEHRGFVIADTVTPKNCASCHAQEYAQFERSRHAAPAWAAVYGSTPFTAAQIAYSEQYQPGAVRRAPNALVGLEGNSAIAAGCATCHAVGKPHADGSIGSCTVCHARHSASVALARLPTTCGQCHMGPDHSQLEIYSESKHGVLFALRRDQMNLEANPKQLTTLDMSVPTCATCHMSGLGGLGVTHDVTERLSWYLFQAVSEKRPDFAQARARMQAVCANCHASEQIKSFYARADSVVAATNAKVAASTALMDSLKADGLITGKAFSQPIDFVAFDLWHYYGRTTKHGAFMGGADFTQWHGNYELLAKMVELRQMAQELRSARRPR
ncbi:MAG: nitrate reductase, partial [Gemmatimonadota bacterium]|nr:nitrate reductase [Gemmatimonadota bacterium]